MRQFPNIRTNGKSRLTFFANFRIGGIEIKNKNRRCHAELSNLGLEFDILGQNQKRATGGTMKETLYSCGFD